VTKAGYTGDTAPSNVAIAWNNVAKPNDKLTGPCTENKYYEHGNAKLGVKDQVIKAAYIGFARQHPAYMLELLGLYKPLEYVQSAVVPSISSIPAPVWLILAGLAALAAFLVRGEPGASQVAVVAAGAVGGSHLSVLWAYGFNFTAIDAVWSLLFACLCSLAYVFSFSLRWRVLGVNGARLPALWPRPIRTES
jgi:hypothetical protein